jgi:hypothetical protein
MNITVHKALSLNRQVLHDAGPFPPRHLVEPVISLWADNVPVRLVIKVGAHGREGSLN